MIYGRQKGRTEFRRRYDTPGTETGACGKVRLLVLVLAWKDGKARVSQYMGTAHREITKGYQPHERKIATSYRLSSRQGLDRIGAGKEGARERRGSHRTVQVDQLAGVKWDTMTGERTTGL